MISWFPFSLVSTQQPAGIFKTQIRSYHSPAHNSTHFLLWPDKLSSPLSLLCSPCSTHAGLAIVPQIGHRGHCVHHTFYFCLEPSQCLLPLSIWVSASNVTSLTRFLSNYPSTHGYALLFLVLALAAIILQQSDLLVNFVLSTWM